ncbi:MAG: M20 family metallopeptidase, partial [Solirubrobacteraceae bacterium]
GDGRANLVARISGADRRPGLLLCGHLDTVPVRAERWTVPPLGGVVLDGRLFGRGAVDMKGSVAAMAIAVRNVHARGLALEGDLVLGCTAGEEVDSFGARAMADAGLLEGIGTAVIGEPTGLTVGVGHRGALWVSVGAKGRPAHGSRPDRGTNAVRLLLDWLHPFGELEALVAEGSDDLLGRGSLSLNLIEGGQAPNVVPDRASATLDFRTLPTHDHDALLSALRARGEAVEVSVLRNNRPVLIAEDAPLARAAAAAVSFVTGSRAVVRGLPYMTDASVFASELGIPVVIVGPGPETDAHTDDESVEIAELERASAVYEHLIERVLHV